MRFCAVSNPNWQKQNGISVLTMAGKVNAPFFLAMGDHLFESSILEKLVLHADLGRLNLAVDRKIASVFDLDDAMKVQTQKKTIVTIGKNLQKYDAIDTGVFLCPQILFDYLRRAVRENDCSLADGVQLMAKDGNALAIDIGDSWWQDVDTHKMLAEAEQKMMRLFSSERGVLDTPG